MPNKRIPFWQLRGTKGSLLILAYLVVFVLLTLGAVFLILSVNERRFAERQRRSVVVFHIAEAGIERALYDLRQDFVTDSTSPSWADGDIHNFTIGPNTSSFYTINYASTSLNGGSYAVQLKNISGINEAIWVRSTGTLGDTSQTIEVYAKIINLSPWNNAIFAGAGASGAMINGNVNIRGSVHILGSGVASTDLVVDLGGTSELIGNNYKNMESSLLDKIPDLPTISFGGETIETLNAELRVKRGIVGLSGSSSVGEANVAGNAYKETIDGAYVTNGYGGNQGTNNVHSDNGTTNTYDLGNSVAFPSLSDPYGGYGTYQQYLQANALVISNASDRTTLANITPNSNFSFSSAKGSITMNGSGGMTVSGIVYIPNGGSFNTSKAGANKNITYTGTGVILAEGNVQINTNLESNGNDSFPSNILGIMTPGNIGFNEASINVMGLFYAEGSVVAEKQTDVVGTIVSNYFNMGTNVPSVYQVPDIITNLPAGLIGQEGTWIMQIVSWQKI